MSREDRNAAERLAKEGIYSEVPEITERIIHAIPKLRAEGILFEDAKPIPYGSRLSLCAGDTPFSITLYFSRKKGISAVPDKSAPQAPAEIACRIFTRETKAHPASKQKREQRFRCWIGSDEAGKGDYFGPLVVAAFRGNMDIAATLRKMGVQDSKRLSDTRCTDIAKRLYGAFKDRICVVELPPETYNRLYTQFTKQRKNLNHLLTWAHTKAISSVLTRDVEAVVVDQFAAAHLLRYTLKPRIPLIQRHRAEDNVAVAAASIIARARYIYRLDILSRETKIRLTPGSGASIDAIAARLINEKGLATLRSVAKWHFKNTEKYLRNHGDS